MALRIRKGDLVQVVSGADKGKQGRVLAVDRERRAACASRRCASRSAT